MLYATFTGGPERPAQTFDELPPATIEFDDEADYQRTDGERETDGDVRFTYLLVEGPNPQ